MNKVITFLQRIFFSSEQFEHDEDFYKDDPMTLFWKKILVNKRVALARLYISGLGYYEANLDISKISRNMPDPGFTAYRKQRLYVRHDITRGLKKGNSHFGAMVGDGWYNALPLRLLGRFYFRDVQQTGRRCPGTNGIVGFPAKKTSNWIN
ncbi:MAG: alpha-L-rhamnosidase N-terminal domain-containing protein [Chitinophagaceae bacterium]